MPPRQPPIFNAGLSERETRRAPVRTSTPRPPLPRSEPSALAPKGLRWCGASVSGFLTHVAEAALAGELAVATGLDAHIVELRCPTLMAAGVLSREDPGVCRLASTQDVLTHSGIGLLAGSGFRAAAVRERLLESIFTNSPVTYGQLSDMDLAGEVWGGEGARPRTGCETRWRRLSTCFRPEQ